MAEDESAGFELASAYDFLLKCILIGESGTGKSCLLHHFVNNQFRTNSAHTIGVEFSSRIVKIGNKNVKLQLWDTAGQERFRSVTRSYYRGAAVCILVYDITKRTTYEPLSRWLADARAVASPDLAVVVVGNKLDRADDEREVSQLEATQWASDNGVLFLETSSLTGENVETPFLLAARSILLAIESGRLDPEKPGSGISFGDRTLRRLGSGSRLSFGFGSASGAGSDAGSTRGRSGGVIRLKNRVTESFEGCCS
ncbi:ras-domain-containing protein [Tilletiaria anomala UBC 951]|uniref:Ras-domain-containing protein n=1 Tax=Tilletiaria anomala (strain ATCC 24038 / CBS 436.72 / UBC 951) TaxID=1037660 RepID=A0A066VMD9_TILAU|nr:ras-domain-containing protein [Tilletiaria anomala UBC 951]KDN41438.1 ras-domain-containing protein [Tilletiaria anomala UBC 951]